jgi:hypothetical protein
MKYLLGETWIPPALSMIQNTFGKKKSGRMVSAFLFYCTVAGTASTAVCGFLSHYFNTQANPMALGKILACVSAFQYVGSIPFFIKSGQEYSKKWRQKQREEMAADCVGLGC